MGYGYTMGNLPIFAVKEHNDLGMLRTADFSHGKYVAKLAIKLIIWWACFFVPLYLTQVPSCLTYGSSTLGQS